MHTLHPAMVFMLESFGDVPMLLVL